MFLDDSFMEEVNITQEGESKKTRRIRIAIIASMAVLILLLLGEFVLFRYIKPSMSSPKVTITGFKNMTAEDVAVKLIPMSNRNWFTFDIAQATGILSSESSIKNVVVEKHFPDTILVNIEERVPVAVTYVSENGRSKAMQIDESGVLFSNRSNTAVAQSGVPIISGIPVEHMTGGMKIPSIYNTLLEEIALIQSLPVKYFDAVSEICVLPKDTGSYELQLIPSNGHIKVLTDRALNEEALKYMMVVVDVVKKLKPDAKTVDMRYGSVSY